MAAAAAAWEEDEWVLCNDDGFVYKRRKKRRVEEDSLASASPNQEAEQRQRRRSQKKQTLMMLRHQYQTEIDGWQQLSNTLREMEGNSNQHHQQLQRQQPSSSVVAQKNSESVFRPLVAELLLQAEAQEAIIQNLSKLCDEAEAMCKAKGERLNQSLIDLPVWATPRHLLASLSDQDYSNNDDGIAHIT